MLSLVTFGDSILDSGRYNACSVTPGQLLVTNDDRLFPEFRGRDLSSRGPARLEHRARRGYGWQPAGPGARAGGPGTGRGAADRRR
jgi:hypothetical protein